VTKKADFYLSNQSMLEGKKYTTVFYFKKRREIGIMIINEEGLSSFFNVLILRV